MIERQIKQLCRWMRKSNTVRQIANRIQNSDAAISLEEVDRLLITLTKGNELRWREKLVVLHIISRFKFEDDTLAKVLNALHKVITGKEMGSAKRSIRRAITAFLMTYLLSSALCAFLYFCFSGFDRSNQHGAVIVYGMVIYLIFSGFVSIFAAPAFAILLSSHQGDVRIAAIELLGRIGHTSSARALSSVIGNNEKVTQQARKALAKILPVITEADYGKLGHNASRNIARLLLDKREPSKLIVLEALRNAGDGSAVDDVREFIERTANPSMKQAAITALTALEARKRNEDAQRLLLRPSAAPSEDTLLRPVAHAPDEDVALLLRPAEEGDLNR